MNRRGFADNFLFGMIGFFILILVITSLMPYYYGQDTSKINLDWYSLNVSQKFIEGDENIAVDVTYKLVDFIGYSSFRVAEGAVNFGVERPDIVNPLILFYLIIISLCAPILLVLFKFLIIIFLLLKELHHKRKDNKKLKDYKKLREKRLLLKKELKGGQGK